MTNDKKADAVSNFVELTTKSDLRLSVRPGEIKSFWESKVEAESSGGMLGQTHVKGEDTIQTFVDTGSADGTAFSVKETYDAVKALVDGTS